MAIFKCKMCGGALEIAAGASVIECEYCGTQQTLPKLDDDRRANMYDRANHFRRNNEFDKAMSIYENILNEDGSDAEAYWSLVLCRYGIEYVEDPSSHKRIPTVNRAQFTSIFDDNNYKSAIQYADSHQKALYEAESNAINEIQKGILAISQKEEPFDVFICYKETDNHGRRTPDSVLANDLYHQLTQEGFKVFFSRITLEDKLGSAYEPYIFAALNSAKVMVVLGTKAEYFNAVWVKNEWSRFLSLIKNGATKTLIPAYRDMDPYNLPEEFSHLQAQDMSKLGFMQDLIRGIKKITHTDAPSATTVVKETVVTGGSAVGNTSALLERGFMALEDGEWDKADNFFEEVLNQDAKCASAYLGKLMAELQVKTQDKLKDCEKPFVANGNYQKAMRFGDEKLKAMLTDCIEHIEARNEKARMDGIYNKAKSAMDAAKLERDFIDAANQFESIAGHLDASDLAKKCLEKAEATRKDLILERANKPIRSNSQYVSEYEDAITLLKSIPGWKDADNQLLVCKNKIAEIEAQKEAERIEYEHKKEHWRKEAKKRKKKKKIIAVITVSAIAIIAVFVVLMLTVFIPNSKYNAAVSLMEDGKYNEALSAFEAMDGYKDSAEKITVCETAIRDIKYNDAVSLMDEGKYAEAILVFEALDGYKDSADKITECETAAKAAAFDRKYNDAVALMDAEQYKEALALFAEFGDYKDARKHFSEALKASAEKHTIVAGYDTVGLKTDGTVVITGLDANLAYNWTDIVAVAAGGNCIVGLKSDGTVIAVGYNEHGQCNVSDWKDIVAVDTSGSHTVGLKSDGTLVATGDNSFGKCNVSGWEDIVAIACGAYHTVGLKTDGTVVTEGDTLAGCRNIFGWEDIVAIAAGSWSTVGLKSDGSVVAVGANTFGQRNVSGWEDIVAVDTSGRHTVGLKADGTVVAVGDNKGGQCDVSDWTDIVAVAVGDYHTVGLKSDGTVVATGKNYNYACSVSKWTDIKIPN